MTEVPQNQTKVTQAFGVSLKTGSTFVLVDPTEILEALVGLKDVQVVHYRRIGPNVELMVEQTPGVVRCRECGGSAEIK